MERISIPDKHWKHNDGDRDSRAKWDDYMAEYEKVFTECNESKWNIVPSDQKWWKVYTIATILLQEFEKMDLKWPDLDSELFEDGERKAE
jgi:polyphosphate kinase 2 (PPK2 family)